MPNAPIRQIVRWMMAARKDGRWGNTQENAHAMEALVNYYRKYESDGAELQRGRDAWHARSSRASSSRPLDRVDVINELPMPQVLATGRGRHRRSR